MGYYIIWSAKTIDGEKNNHGYSQIKFDHYLILIHMYNVDIRHHINLISWCYNSYFRRAFQYFRRAFRQITGISVILCTVFSLMKTDLHILMAGWLNVFAHPDTSHVPLLYPFGDKSVLSGFSSRSSTYNFLKMITCNKTTNWWKPRLWFFSMSTDKIRA